MEIGMFQLHGM